MAKNGRKDIGLVVRIAIGLAGHALNPSGRDIIRDTGSISRADLIACLDILVFAEL